MNVAKSKNYNNQNEKMGNTDSSQIVFLGSPLIDITVRIDDAFLKQYSLQSDNAYRKNQANSKIFEDIKGKTAEIQIGGSVTNTVRVFRKLCNSSEKIAYFGSIGKDDHGQWIKKQLLHEGIGSHLMEIEGENTGKVAVLLRGKARTLVTDLGASRVFHFGENAWKTISEASFIYVSAFFIGVSFGIITEIVDKLQKSLILNLGAPFLSSKHPKEMTYLYQNANLVFGNESEHRALATVHNITSPNLAETVTRTNRMHPNKSRVIIVTRGDQSVLAVTDQSCEEFDVHPLDDVDSNGAGDVFVGGFLARHVAGDSVANCIKCGIEMVQKKLQRH